MKHHGMQAVRLEGFGLACDLGSGYAPTRVEFAEVFQTLAVLDGARSIVVFTLGALFSVSDVLCLVDAEITTRGFTLSGLATLRLKSELARGNRAGPAP